MILKYLLFADDVTCLMAHEHKPTFQLAARDGSVDMQGELLDLGLNSATEKSENILMSPREVAEGLHRRTQYGELKAAFQLEVGMTSSQRCDILMRWIRE